MNDLIIDPQIRTWVFVPIVLLTFLAGILRHYLQILLKSEKPIDLKKIKESQALLRSQALQKNGGYLTASSYNVRKAAMIVEMNAILEENKQQNVAAFEDLTEQHFVLKETVFGNLVNYLPMVVIGSWCMYLLSGFILTKIPFPLTLRFKPMLQKDIYLKDLSAEWVSSASWYFLNVFGLRGFYNMILGNNLVHDQLIENAAALPQNTNAIFKNEIEVLTIHEHNCYID